MKKTPPAIPATTTALVKRRRFGLGLLAALLLLGAGLYLLLATLWPLARGQFINPTNNPTTTRIAQTAQHIPAEPRLYIPKIDVNVPYGTDQSSLLTGAWWRAPDSGNPADGGNFVVAAHRFSLGFTPQQTEIQSPFLHINRLRLGDEIVVDYQAKRYRYRIEQIHAVRPSDVHIEQRTDRPQLTLYSCTLGGSADGREVIIAQPVRA